VTSSILVHNDVHENDVDPQIRADRPGSRANRNTRETALVHLGLESLMEQESRRLIALKERQRRPISMRRVEIEEASVG